MKRKPRPKKVASQLIMFFVRHGQMPPGSQDLVRSLSRNPKDLMTFNNFIVKHCPDLTRALILLERSGIDSIHEPSPIGQGCHPGSKNPVGSSGGDTVKDREYQ